MYNLVWFSVCPLMVHVVVWIHRHVWIKLGVYPDQLAKYRSTLFSNYGIQFWRKKKRAPHAYSVEFTKQNCPVSASLVTRSSGRIILLHSISQLMIDSYIPVKRYSLHKWHPSHRNQRPLRKNVAGLIARSYYRYPLQNQRIGRYNSLRNISMDRRQKEFFSVVWNKWSNIKTCNWKKNKYHCSQHGHEIFWLIKLFTPHHKYGI